MNLAFFGRDALVASANCRGFAIASVVSLFLATASLFAAPQPPRISIVHPPAGSTVPLTKECYVTGSITPANAPLTCNGKPVKPYRTGGFLFMFPLRNGRNTMVFQSGKTKITHSFFAKPETPVAPPDRITPLTPKHPVGTGVNEPVSLVCIAPAGRKVFAMAGERTIALRPNATVPSRYEAAVSFPFPVENVPILFWSDGLEDQPAGSITVRKDWPCYRVTGPLFEVRLRSLPGDGDTIGFLPPGYEFRSSGFYGQHVRVIFADRTGYVSRSDLRELPSAKLPAVPVFPDIARGYPARPQKGKRPQDLLIVVDAGHGGNDSGALGPCRKMEKTANLAQAKRIEQALRKAGFRVLMTRTDDRFIGLYDRVRQAYAKRADAFISVHHNATGSGGNPATARSIGSFVWNERGKALAECIEPHIAAVSGIRDNGVSMKSLAVCRNPATPSCLLEFDFINCPEGEEAIFDADRQEKFAAAVVKGVLDWIAGKK